MELSSLMGQNKENKEVKEYKKGRRETEKIVRNLILKIEEGWGRLQMFQTIFTPHRMTMPVI